MAADLAAVTPYGPLGASSRVRVFDWLAHLPQISASVYPYIGAANASPRTLTRAGLRVVGAERKLRDLRASHPQRLLLHREASPFSRGGLERSLAKSAELSVYDFDDALQWDTPRSAATRLFPKPAKCLAAVRAVDRVIAGNDTLANWATDHAREVLVIPSCVDPQDYILKTNYALSDPPRMVWLGSPSTEQYLASIAPALLRLHDRYGVRLTVISGPTRDLAELGVLVDRVTWSASTFADQLSASDVGIAPLVDTPYARGKCAYKVLQYGAAGLPFIATPVGANELATNRLCGLAATSQDEWFEAVESVLEVSAESRNVLGRKGREAVELQYSFNAWHQVWSKAVLNGGVK